MTRQETAQIVAGVRLLWPHSNLGSSPQEIVTTWHALLQAFSVDHVEHAVRELSASGREFAPPPGVVVSTCADRAVDTPDWDEAWGEIDRLIRRRGSRGVEPEHFSHPLIAAFAIPCWLELCQGPAPGTKDFGTHYAQTRNSYLALRARVQRGAALDAIGAPRSRPGLPRGMAAVLGDALPGLPDGRAA